MYSPYGAGAYGSTLGGGYGVGGYGSPMYGGAAGGMYGGGGMMPYGAQPPGLLNGITTSVDSVTRVSQIVQMVSEAIHMTFSSAVRLATNVGMFSHELSAIGGAITVVRALAKVYARLRDALLRLVGLTSKADELKMRNAWKQAGRDPNYYIQHPDKQPSWLGLLFTAFGTLYLIKRIWRVLFPLPPRKPLPPTVTALLPNGQAVQVVAMANGQRVVLSPNGQKCPVVPDAQGQPQMIAPNGQPVPLRLVKKKAIKDAAGAAADAAAQQPPQQQQGAPSSPSQPLAPITPSLPNPSGAGSGTSIPAAGAPQHASSVITPDLSTASVTTAAASAASISTANTSSALSPAGALPSTTSMSSVVPQPQSQQQYQQQNGVVVPNTGTAAPGSTETHIITPGAAGLTQPQGAAFPSASAPPATGALANAQQYSQALSSFGATDAVPSPMGQMPVGGVGAYGTPGVGAYPGATGYGATTYGAGVSPYSASPYSTYQPPMSMGGMWR